MKNSYKVLLLNTFIFAVGNIFVKLIAFLLMPLYTTYLSAEQYGISELLNNAVEIIMPIGTLCIIEALYRFSIDKEANYKLLFTNSMVMILLGNLLVGCGCLFVYFYSDYPYTINFLFLYISSSFYRLTTQFARGLGHIKRFATYGILNALILLCANIISFSIFKGGISAYLNSISFSFGCTSMFAFVISQEYRFIQWKSFNFIYLLEMLRYSLPTIPNMIAWWVNNISSRYILLYYCGINLAGIYTAACKLPALINLVTLVFQQAWQFSAASEIDDEESAKFFSNVFRCYSYICVNACALLILFNQLICVILLKEEFYSAYRFIPLLVFAATLNCISTYFGTLYQALKNNVMLMVSTIWGALVNISLNLILIPYCDVLGAVLTAVVTYTIITIIRIMDIKKKLKITINFYKFIFQLIVLFISAIATSVMNNSLYYPIVILSALLILYSDYPLLCPFIKKYLTDKINIFTFMGEDEK